MTLRSVIKSLKLGSSTRTNSGTFCAVIGYSMDSSRLSTSESVPGGATVAPFFIARDQGAQESREVGPWRALVSGYINVQRAIIIRRESSCELY